jgi:hypothetical protein
LHRTGVPPLILAEKAAPVLPQKRFDQPVRKRRIGILQHKKLPRKRFRRGAVLFSQEIEHFFVHGDSVHKPLGLSNLKNYLLQKGEGEGLSRIKARRRNDL